MISIIQKNMRNYEIENLKAIQKYHTEWKIREKDYQKTILTEVLEIHIIELPKIEEALKHEELSKNKLLVWTEYEARIAELRTKHIMDSKSIEEYGFDKGMEKGIEKGKLDIAKRLLKMKISIEEIAEITELTVEEIENLK